MQLPISDI